MKNLMIGLMVLVASAQAEARSLRRYLAAPLNHFQFQADTTLANRDIQGGNIAIDFFDKQITLSLQPAWHCPAGAMCAMVMPAAVEYTLPVVETKIGSCQERIYIARHDARPVDGALTQITVVDNSTNFCEYFAAIPTTEVTLEISFIERTHGQELRQVHKMTGEKLQ